MYKVLGLLVATAAFGCGHAQTTGSARNDWATPTGQATATAPTRVDAKEGVDLNTARRHDDTYGSRYNTPENAPSEYGRVPPPAAQTAPPAGEPYTPPPETP